jgi:hypothetical protein
MAAAKGIRIKERSGNKPNRINMLFINNIPQEGATNPKVICLTFSAT